MSGLDLLAGLAGNTDNVIVYRIFGVKIEVIQVMDFRQLFHI